MGRAQDLTAIWRAQRDLGSICEIDCCCECHEVDDPPCVECCTYVEDEVAADGS